MIADRLEDVRERIRRAAESAGRDPGDVVLVAVSKTHRPEDVLEAARAGAGHFGENRVQELVAKAAEVAEAGDREPQVHEAPQWHLIGPLQRNKVKDVVGRGWWLHTLDRTALVERVARASGSPAEQAVLVQVNVGDDPAKHGCRAADAPRLVEEAVTAGLDVRGLMTIPPMASPGADPNDAARRHFSALRELRDLVARDHEGLVELSMGMSADLDAAVAEGATLVRIGTAIFGQRPDQPWVASVRTTDPRPGAGS